MPKMTASAKVDKQTLIKTLESIGIRVDDLMASPQGFLSLKIESLNEEEASVSICKTRSSEK